MIKLQHGYQIESSNGSLVLVKYGKGKNKDDEEIETKNVCGYYTNLEHTLQSYLNNVVIDAVGNFELELKDVQKIIKELKEELKQYG